MRASVSVCMVQMTSTNELSRNLAMVEEALSSTDLTETNLVVLPEMFALFGVGDQRELALSETEFDGPVGCKVRQWAKDFNVWIVAGTVPVLVDGESKPRARCHVVSSEGDVIATYDKIHLFDADVADQQRSYRESDSYAPGSDVATVLTPWGTLGLAVCYDLRFPELFRALNDQGAEFVIVPSAFTHKTGSAHWEVLCRARAIENGYFVVGVNQCGTHDQKRQTWGHSMMVNPWGETVSLEDLAATKQVVLDLSQVSKVREQIPVNVNRRLS